MYQDAETQQYIMFFKMIDLSGIDSSVVISSWALFVLLRSAPKMFHLMLFLVAIPSS
jgi:hypothetical protein